MSQHTPNSLLIPSFKTLRSGWDSNHGFSLQLGSPRFNKWRASTLLVHQQVILNREYLNGNNLRKNATKTDVTPNSFFSLLKCPNIHRSLIISSSRGLGHFHTRSKFKRLFLNSNMIKKKNNSYFQSHCVSMNH